MEDLYAVIFAGGVGSRLWPVSRVGSPKQVKPFMGSGQTLIQKTWERVRKILPPEQIYVSTNKNYAIFIQEQLPELLPDRIIIEPELRNTCSAIGLATAIIRKRHGNAVITNVWADHYYAKEEDYAEAIRRIYAGIVKYPEAIMSVGLEVEYPSSAYGYLEVEPNSSDDLGLVRVRRFVEKPDIPTAEEFKNAGNYYWNPALFMWRADRMLNLYKKLVPDIYEGLMEIQSVWDTDDQNKVLGERYPKFTKVSVEYAILEKGPAMWLLPANLGWRDVGNWQAVYDVIRNGESDVASKGRGVVIDSKDVLIFNEDDQTLVTAVGLEDIAIINTKDAVLVIRKSRDQDVKKLVEKLEKDNLKEYL